MTNPNDPAFSSELVDPMLHDKAMKDSLNTAMGLSKREYFAARAMQGFLMSRLGENSDVPEEKVAKASIVMADALIAELSKESK